MNLPQELVENILTFSTTYYKENYKNRNGQFYKQIEEARKIPLANVYVPIIRYYSKNRHTSEKTFYHERKLGKYVLCVKDFHNHDYFDDIDHPDPEEVYETVFYRSTK